MPEVSANRTKPRPHYDGVKDAIVWGMSFVVFAALLVMLLLSIFTK